MEIRLVEEVVPSERTDGRIQSSRSW